MGVWSVGEGDGAFLDACGGDSSRRCSSKRCLLSFGNPRFRGEMGLGTRGGGTGHQGRCVLAPEGPVMALEEMGLDTKEGFALELEGMGLGARGGSLGAGRDGIGYWGKRAWAFGALPWGWCIWIRKTVSRGSCCGSCFNRH